MEITKPTNNPLFLLLLGHWQGLVRRGLHPGEYYQVVVRRFHGHVAYVELL